MCIITRRTLKYLRKPLWLGAGLLTLGLISAPRSYGQFGIDTAAILAGLNALNQTMQSVMQTPMQALQADQQKLLDFEQNTVWPVSQITAAWQSAVNSANYLQTAHSIMSTSIQSAKMQINQQFEQDILSGNIASIKNVASEYASTYGLPMNAQQYAKQLPATTIVALDANDAVAQECLKKAIELDATAEQETQVAQQLLTQLQTSAPGVAPVISAQAAAWLVQGGAVTQSAIAQLLRAQAADVAYQGYELKQAGTTTQGLSTSFQGLSQGMVGSTSATPSAAKVKRQ